MSSPRLAAFLLAVALPATAHAQFGGLIRRATERVVDKVANKAVDKVVDDNTPNLPGCTPEYDKYTIELTGDQLDRMLKGLDAVAAAGARAGRNDLVKERDALEARVEDLADDPGIQRFEKNREDYGECKMKVWGETLEKRYAGKDPLTALFGADPAAQTRNRQLEERAVAAEKAGQPEQAKLIRDSAAYVMLGGSKASAEDSAAIVKKCGNPPVPPKRLQQRDSLRIALRTLDEKIAQIDDDNGDALYDQSKMTRRQVAVARERILTALNAQSTPCGFSKAELAAIRERRDRLKAYIK